MEFGWVFQLLFKSQSEPNDINKLSLIQVSGKAMIQRIYQLLKFTVHLKPIGRTLYVG